MPLATRGPEVHEESWQLVTAVQDTGVGPTFWDGHSKGYGSMHFYHLGFWFC